MKNTTTFIYDIAHGQLLILLSKLKKSLVLVNCCEIIDVKPGPYQYQYLRKICLRKNYILVYFESQQKIFEFLHQGSFNNYVDRREWVGGQSNVYAYKVNERFLFT